MTKEAAPPEAPPSKTEREGFLDFLKELPILIVVAFAIALLIKTFLVQAFFIPSGSMENTLIPSDRVLVSKLSYRLGQMERNHIIVFRGPETFTSGPDRGPVGNFFNTLAEGLGLRSSEQDFIKRVIALEGDTLEIRDGAVFVNGERLEEPYLHDSAPITCSGQHCGPFEIPQGRVFVMGDNRAHSRDSRAFGPVRTSEVVGKAFVLIWPPDRVRRL